MSVTVRIPTPLRELTDGAAEVAATQGSLRHVLASLDDAHPGIGERLLDEDGALRRFVNIFVSDTDVRFLDNLDTPVAEGEVVSIIPAIAGG